MSRNKFLKRAAKKNYFQGHALLNSVFAFFHAQKLYLLIFLSGILYKYDYNDEQCPKHKSERKKLLKIEEQQKIP
jgi:hypothetical protein